MGCLVEIREYKRATRCEFGGRLRRCRTPLSGQCQYCARGFCDDHGERFNEIEEVCPREPCQAKKADLIAHKEFRRVAVSRNDRNVCGEPECETAPATDCQRCFAHYCVAHLSQRMMTVWRGAEPSAEIIRICSHCSSRIPLWEAE